jgi:hypothetical protein
VALNPIWAFATSFGPRTHTSRVYNNTAWNKRRRCSKSSAHPMRAFLARQPIQMQGVAEGIQGIEENLCPCKNYRAVIQRLKPTSQFSFCVAAEESV